MLYKASHIMGLPIAAIEEKEKIGAIREIVIDRKDASIIGFIVDVGGVLFHNKKFISQVDVLDIDEHGVTTRTNENIIDPSQVVRVKKIVDDGFRLVGMPTYTRSKKYLGRVNDYVIDTKTLSVIKFYINNLLDHKIFDYKKVYKIKKDKIIFKDDVEKVRTQVLKEKIAID